MVNLTLKQFRYFDALAVHGHFGRAADVSGISQPALSMQIKELEDSLGSQLFERSARQVRLTAFGEDLAPRVRDILRSVDEVEDLARQSQNTLTGRLRIGVIPTIAPYLLPSFLGHLTHTYPTLDVHVRETQTQTLIEELTHGRLDAAIVALPVSEPTLEEVTIFEEDFVLVRPVADSDAPVPNAADLAKMQLLLLEEGHCFRDQALAFCSLRSSLPRESMDGSSLSTLVQLVGAGIGVTLIPRMAIGVETQSANVAVASFKGAQPKRTIGMVWRKTSPLAEQYREIVSILEQASKTVR
ncbi:hydrogen peroxide-inducible genes activator [Octadecabacter sp. CECT 8868]|uniref:hydrogen peroxide-inducible genes activator n=1 Tax=Octadecabacter algicola TaxID=2909342 RepID=UPI001F459637|nr:hydrogen peroxide-inducible genes activator [Octadecabacter algicola]MCF2903976.1 hydrogen peroxide-inducible genes activator [Octadecabacter algicola]